MPTWQQTCQQGYAIWQTKEGNVISLRPVVRADLDALFALRVHSDQQAFVAPNAVTLAEVHYISGGYVFGIWADDALIGLLAMIDFREHDDLFEEDDPNAAFMLRLMVGANQQGRGYGRAATRLAIEWAKTRNNSCFQTSVDPANVVTRRFYLSLGLRETGRIVEGEVEMSLILTGLSDGSGADDGADRQTAVPSARNRLARSFCVARCSSSPAATSMSPGKATMIC